MAIVSLLLDDAPKDENQDAKAEHVPLELLPLRWVDGALIVPFAARRVERGILVVGVILAKVRVTVLAVVHEPRGAVVVLV